MANTRNTKPATSAGPEHQSVEVPVRSLNISKHNPRHLIYQLFLVVLLINAMAMINLPGGLNLMRPRQAQHQAAIYLTSSAFSVGRFGWPGLEWREIIDWWTSGYSRGVVIGRNYIPPCKLCDMPRMFRVDK